MKNTLLLCLFSLLCGCEPSTHAEERAVERAKLDYNCDQVTITSRTHIGSGVIYKLDVCGEPHKYADIGQRVYYFVELK